MKKVIYSALCILALTACGNTRREHSEVKQIVNSNNYLINTDAFDLEAVISALTSGQHKDVKALQEFANKEGVNNVDFDKDGKIDFIKINEGSRGAFDFISKGSSDGIERVIASINITKEQNDVYVSGGYTDHVQGHSDLYYREQRRSDLVDAILLMHILSPGRTMYMGHMPMGYAPRTVMPASKVSLTRRTVRRENKLKPVSKTTSQPKSLSKSLKRNPRVKDLSSRAGSRDYNKRDKNKKKKQTTSVLGKNRNKQNKKYNSPKPRRQKPPRRPRPPRRRRR